MNTEIVGSCWHCGAGLGKPDHLLPAIDESYQHIARRQGFGLG